MLAHEQSLRPNTEEVVHKVIDGEAVIIRLSDGIYYNMDQTAGLIWEQIEKKNSLKGIVEAITAEYDVSSDEARADVERLTRELLDERLITVDGNTVQATPVAIESGEQKMAYTSPQLTIYRDMAELLALDPPAPGMQDLNWMEE